MGADDGLNTGHSVNRPEKGKPYDWTLTMEAMMNNTDEKKSLPGGSSVRNRAAKT